MDLGTVKEMLKVFINMVLWRKVRKDVIQIACYLCDIALMVNSKDVNLMAVFCLAQLSENEKSHKYFFRTVNPTKKGAVNEEAKFTIFSRINCLIDSYQAEDLQGYSDAQTYLKAMIAKFGPYALSETNKNELLMNLIMQFYLNLSRNESITHQLNGLELYSRIRNLIERFLKHEQRLKESPEVSMASSGALRAPAASEVAMETSIVCYANSILTRLVLQSAEKDTIFNEMGHVVLMQILQRPKMYQHLNLETLESIKYLVTEKRYLGYFQELPRYIEFTKTPEDDINLAFLQAAALISFNPGSHEEMKEQGLIGKIIKAGLLKVALLTLRHEDSFGQTLRR